VHSDGYFGMDGFSPRFLCRLTAFIPLSFNGIYKVAVAGYSIFINAVKRQGKYKKKHDIYLV
jgi:hypothetical protein